MFYKLIRVVVKFSVDDFESDKTTAWEGVRNHEAKNLMKEMKVGDKARAIHFASGEFLIPF